MGHTTDITNLLGFRIVTGTDGDSVAGINAGDVVAKLRASTGGSWKETAWDGLQAGAIDATVTGVAVVWAPGLTVLKEAVAKGCNLILCKDPLYWFDPEDKPSKPDSMYMRLPEGAMGMGKMDAIEKTPAYVAKHDFITTHNLTIYRISENWDGGHELATQGLLQALGWKQTDSIVADDRFPNTRTALVSVPSQDLIQIAEHAKTSVGSKSTRVVGEKTAKVSKVAVHPGFLTTFAASKICRTQGLDLIVTGEANEWEAFVHCEDWITAGHGKGLVMLGLAATSDTGAKEVAGWVRKTVPGTKVEFIAVGDPLTGVKAGSLRA
jgi:putative NIF3 family GTP cyclohydrolase 1 type 2